MYLVKYLILQNIIFKILLITKYYFQNIAYYKILSSKYYLLQNDFLQNITYYKIIFFIAFDMELTYFSWQDVQPMFGQKHYVKSHTPRFDIACVFLLSGYL